MTKKMKVRAISLALSLLSLLIFPKVTFAVIIGEYSTWPAVMSSDISSGLTADSYGNIWFAPLYGYQVGRITPAGQVDVFPLPSYGYLTGSIVAGPDGNIWYGTEFTGKIGRIRPTGEITEFSLSMDSVGALAAGPDGNVWFSGSGGVVGRITPSGDIRKFQFSEGANAITAGPDGNLWFVQVAANKIGRMTTSGSLTEFTVPTENAAPFNITLGPDGNLWFIEGIAEKIGRISLTGVITEFKIPYPRCGPYDTIGPVGIIAGPDGNLWFTEHQCDRIGRITPDGVFLPELATPSAFSAPGQITASPDGLLWFTESSNRIGVISQANVQDSFPLNSGNVWNYEKNGVYGTTRTVSPGVFNINGVDTKRIQFSDGSEMYLTSDENGVREHREYSPGPPETLVTFSPPFKFSDVQGMFGGTVSSSGTANGTQGGVPFSLPYSGSSTIQGFEVLNVPAGTFKTAKIMSSISINGTVTQTNWVAPNVGIVKTTVGVDTYLLTSTNVMNTTPDAFWFLPLTGVPLNTPVISNTVEVTGITTPAIITITGGEYRMNGGAYTIEPGTVVNGDTVTLRQISADASYTATTTTLTIGGVSAKFNVRTSFAARPMPWLLLLLGE